MRRRVVITGLGVVTPNGVGKDNFWSALRQGKSGIRQITRFDPTPFPTRIAGEVDLDVPQFITPKQIKRMDRTAHLAMAAAKLAVQDSKLNLTEKDKERTGVIIGTTMAGHGWTLEEFENVYQKKGPMRINTFTAIASFPDASASYISIELDLKGPSLSLATACSSSSDAIGYAKSLIQSGFADIMFTGGSEAPLFAPVFSTFCVLRALSKRNSEPATASRPFDKKRDGFVLSEGAGVVILEELNHAVKRGAHIYAEVAGIGMSCDAYHMTVPQPDGLQAERALKMALKDAGIKPNEIDYINAHGTSTPLNDKIETMVIKNVFGTHAYNVPISSTKSMIGHLIAAAGVVEICAALMAFEKSVIHPTINQEVTDPECDLDYVPNKSRMKDIKTILKNSFGFGGKNSAIVLKKV